MSYSATSSGREIAKQRRQAIASGGAKALARSTGSKASPRSRRESLNGQSHPRTRRAPSAQEATANNAWASSTDSWNSTHSEPAEAASLQRAVDTVCEVAEQNPSQLGNAESAVRQLCRNRRRALATQGKAALPGKEKAAARPRGRRKGARETVAGVSKSGDSKATAPQRSPEDVSFEEAVDTVCEVAEQSPSQLGNAESAVRQLCRNRRRALATQGKAALPGKVGVAARIEARRNGSTNAATSGRELAKLRRAELCRNGRGDAPSCRPTGRVPSRLREAPPKVGHSTTLGGRPFTGTQVERTQNVTGNEPGTCRAITGTEYIGTEQYSQFCGALPEAGTPKVGESVTSRSQPVTGTEVGRSRKVTGDEVGSCKPITGSEYLGVEQFEEFCEARGLLRRPNKVAAGSTPKQIPITGADEARANRISGAEIGASRPITGTVYMDMDALPQGQSPPAPAKVEITHTGRELPVSGTGVGRSEKVTGDEAGFCKPVTGTEYITNEQFQSFCQTKSMPAPPAKVGTDQSRSGLRITGNLVDRSEKVTGNEPGSCQRVTGSQYGHPERYGLCDGAPDKVRTMHTLRGGALTGAEVGHSPKLTGDEHGGCQPVTGTEYVGRDQYEAYCNGTPAPGGEKVGMSHTWHSQPVTGSRVGRSARVTGDEYGACQPVSGSSFIGREQYAEFCDPAAVAAEAERTRVHRATPGMPMTGIQPGPDEQVSGVVKRGVCQPVSGTPYVGADQYADHCPSQEEMAPAEGRQAEAGLEPMPSRRDFSIVSPAREAQLRRRKQRITGTAYGTGAASRVTGPVNLAMGLVSGTPEFRYREEAPPMPAEAAAEASVETPPLPRERITGEGREAGPHITGDDWGRSGSVTGTEGQWAQRRNPTLRRDTGGRAIGAYANKDRERPDVPSPRITGSSGHDEKGAVVTLSGGARG